MPATDRPRVPRLLTYGLPSLAVAGGISLFGWLRYVFQPTRVFLPDRFPQGVWDPSPFGLDVEDAWFPSGDGVSLHGWWIPHARARGTVLFCHGNTGNIASQVGFLRYLRALRVNLLAFDYRGYGRSGGSPTEAGLYCDVRAAHDHLTGSRGVAASEIVIFGHSLGGAVAIEAAATRPAAAVVAQATFTDMRSAVRASYPAPLHLAARNQFRNIDKVGSLRLPKLFVHGTDDPKIPIEHARRLYAAAAEPKELYEIQGADHTDLYRRGGMRYLWRLARFRDAALARAEASETRDDASGSSSTEPSSFRSS